MPVFPKISESVNIPDIFEGFRRLKVLIIGDVMLDSYVFGKVERISPEAPVPVVVAKRREFRLGGAGNVVRNVKSLGAEAIVCTVIGQDGYGDHIVRLIAEDSLTTDGIIQSPQRITTVKERIIAGSQQVCRVDTETEEAISIEEKEQLFQKIKDLARQCDVIIFEDYDKGVLGKDLIADVTAFANFHEIPTVVDPKKKNFLHYHHTTLFKPNLKELKEGLKIDFDVQKPEELERAAAVLKNELSLSGMLITLSERGVFMDFREEKHHIPAHVRQISDVSGAGDTVISVAACCVALKLSPQRIAALSNLAGGLVCEHVGVVPIDPNNLQEEAEKEKI